MPIDDDEDDDLTTLKSAKGKIPEGSTPEDDMETVGGD